MRASERTTYNTPPLLDRLCASRALARQRCGAAFCARRHLPCANVAAGTATANKRRKRDAGCARDFRVIISRRLVTTVDSFHQRPRARIFTNARASAFSAPARAPACSERPCSAACASNARARARPHVVLHFGRRRRPATAGNLCRRWTPLEPTPLPLLRAAALRPPPLSSVLLLLLYLFIDQQMRGERRERPC